MKTLACVYLFEDLAQVRQITDNWKKSYREGRPHEALGSRPPATFRAKIEAMANSTSGLSA
jgi:putative transposase